MWLNCCDHYVYVSGASRPDQAGRRVANDHMTTIGGMAPGNTLCSKSHKYTEETKGLVGIMITRQVCNGENVSRTARDTRRACNLAFQWKGPRAVRPWLSGGTIQLGSGDPRDAQQPNTTTLYSGRKILHIDIDINIDVYMAIGLVMSTVGRQCRVLAPPVRYCDIEFE
jgi:hypothetical protein